MYFERSIFISIRRLTIQVEGDVSGHVPFLLEGFLPWATSGELFNSTLVATRNTTNSPHGALLSDVIARIVRILPLTAPSIKSATLDTGGDDKAISDRRTFVSGVLGFILDARGRLFQYSILYLLEGLVKGLRACSDDRDLHSLLSASEVDKIARIARLPGLPEIAGDLFKEYCAQICDFTNPGWLDKDSPVFQQIGHETRKRKVLVESETIFGDLNSALNGLPSLQALRQQLEASNHNCIQGDGYAPMCQGLIEILDRTDPTSFSHADLYSVLEAFWEEADRRQFTRAVAVHIPSILFHQTCVRACVMQQSYLEENKNDHDLCALLTKALMHLQRLSEGRIYILSMLATSLRKAISTCPELITLLPLEEYILRFINYPPTIRSEFLFEVIAAGKLEQYQPHRTYHSYYGAREWHAYAAVIDLLRRFPEEQIKVARRILKSLLEPWKLQRPGGPIITKWKNFFQLQAMLCLVDFCIEESETDEYLSSFRHALTLEPWPRHRFLLEWIIARIHYRFPGKTSRILEDLSALDENSSAHIASLMKLGVLVAPRETEHFSAKFMTLLVPFSASPKVQIRHESNYAIPIVFDLAQSQGWKSITDNPAFVSLNTFIRSLDKFHATPWTIRTLKLDAVNDFTLVNIFQGQYLTIEAPEKERVAYEDFKSLQEDDRATGLTLPPERIPLGQPRETSLVVDKDTSLILPQRLADASSQSSPAFFQTKSGFDMDSLHPHSGPPGSHNQRPASVILIASLIDNPTNLGGLSRISESFGLEALYINDLRHIVHKDFKATSVTSEKHLPIREMKLAGVPQFLLDMKTKGYEVVGVEQTDQSGILGTEATNLGILPKKCVLVLGSEKGGISAEVLAVIDRCVEIRTVGVTRSLSKCNQALEAYDWV
jgi:tRNA guanosine-2'-O-methyltransferase